MKVLALLLIVIMLNMDTTKPNLESIAEKYVHLALATGQRDPDYVDAYYGPPEWKEEAERQKMELPDIRAKAESLLREFAMIPRPQEDMESLRYDYLKRQIASLRAFANLRLGKKFSFDEESRALYDAVSPHFTEEHFTKVLEELDAALPGKGTTLERLDAFRGQFIIPTEKLDSVFQLALAESEARTRKYITLPIEESFTLEYVTNKPWSGYNWYQGNYRSLIQINTDLPIYIDRAIDLAGHEGYPGHHVYNVLLEQELLRKRNWVEYSVYPLFSPQSLIAEGSANYGVKILFTGNERIEFEQKVLFPAAGLDPSRAPAYYKVQELVDKLSYAGNEAARRLLDGDWTDEQALQWLMKYGLHSKKRAIQRLDFIRKYRSYVINYNLGQDLVAKYIEARSNTPEERWKQLARLLGSPRLPSGLVPTAIE